MSAFKAPKISLIKMMSKILKKMIRINFTFENELIQQPFLLCHDTQLNDVQHSDTQHHDTLFNDIQHKYNQLNGIQHNDSQPNDTQFNDNHHSDNQHKWH
jgi:hypothetical protein